MSWATFSDSHLRAIGEMIQGGSERIIAIVGGALLDDTLRRTLAERLRDDKDTARRLLKPNGPLGNTQPKIDMLYMLKAFGKKPRNAMYGLAEARNFFAHNLDASFNSKHDRMIEAIQKLTLHEGRTHYPHHLFDRDRAQEKYEIPPVQNGQDKFIVNLQLSLLTLMRDRVSHYTHSSVARSDEDIRAGIKKQQEAAQINEKRKKGRGKR